MLVPLQAIYEKLKPKMNFTIKYLTICILLCFSSGFLKLNAQTYAVSGRVVEAQNGVSIPGASIVLLNSKDSSQLKGTASNLDGYFEISHVKTGSYILRVSYLGYQTYDKQLIVSKSNIKLPTLKLTQSATRLEEVEVKATLNRVEIKGDTVEYNANAFKTHADASAEDLIKKMPGVTVEGNTVKVGGEEVKKVLVDGKPFFGDDPITALRNLPSYVIDNVQVFDQQSDQSEFTGFRDGNEEKTLNLKTRRNMNTGVFGKVYAGINADNQYNLGGNYNSFKGNRRISLIGMSNNINQQNFNAADIMSVMSNSGQQGGRGQGGSNFMSGQQSGISTTNAFGLNYSDSWGRKTKISGNYFFNSSKNEKAESLLRNYFTPSGRNYSENSLQTGTNINHRLNIKFEHSIDSSNKIVITPRFTLQDNNSKNETSGKNFFTGLASILNASENKNSRASIGYTLNNDALWQHKFKKRGRTFSANLNIQTSNRQTDAFYYSKTLYTDTISTETLSDREQLNASKSFNSSANFVYTEPLGNFSQLMINLKPGYTFSTSGKTVSNIDSEGNYTLSDTSLSNDYLTRQLSKKGGLNYRFNNNKINFSLGAEVENINLKGFQIFPDSFKTSKYYTYLLPSVSFGYKFTKAISLNINYTTSARTPSVSQLQNTPDVSNPLFIRAGNPLLKPSNENNLRIRFGQRSPEKENHFFLFLMASHTDNYIGNSNYILKKDSLINNYLIKKGSQLSIPENLNNYFTMRLFGVLGFPLGFIKSNLNLHGGYNFSHTPGITDNLLNYTDNHSVNSGFYLSSNISTNLDFSLGYSGSISNTSNNLNTQSASRYYNQSISAKLNLTILNRLVINTEFTQNQYIGLAESYNQSFALWNAFIGYKFLKNRSLELKLSINDILNQNTSINRSISELYTEDIRNNTLTRYAMLTLSYTFKRFSSGSKGPEEMKFPRGMPPPGAFPPPHGERPQ